MTNTIIDQVVVLGLESQVDRVLESAEIAGSIMLAAFLLIAWLLAIIAQSLHNIAKKGEYC